MTTCDESNCSEDGMSSSKTSPTEDNSWHWSNDNEGSTTNDEDPATFQISDSSYGKSLARKLHGMQSADYMCDFTLTSDADGTTFRTHKLLLALSSDFFKRLFEYEPMRTELTLECDSTSLKNLIHFMYAGKVRGNIEDFFEIFRVADCYQIQSFRKEWLKHFENHWVNEKRLIGAFQESRGRRMTPISDVCVDYLLKRMSHKTFTDEFLQSMSVEVFADVLAREDILVTADSSGVLPLGQNFEFRLWQQLRHWLELHHDEDRQQCLTRLAKSINFSCFTQPQRAAVTETCASMGDIQLPDEVFQPSDTDAWLNLTAKRRYCKPRCMRTVSQKSYSFVVLMDEDGPAEVQPPELDRVLRRIDFYANSDQVIQGICQHYENINTGQVEGCVVVVGDTSNGEPFHTVELEENERIVSVRGDVQRILVQIVFETSTGRTIAVPEDRNSVVLNVSDVLFKTPFFIRQSKHQEMYFSFIHCIGAKLNAGANGLVDVCFHWASYKDDPFSNDLCVGGAPETPSRTPSSPFSHDDFSDSDYSMYGGHFEWYEPFELPSD